MARLSFHPLTPDRWDEFVKLFGARGACGGCWCMYWRLPRSEFNKRKGAGNKRAMKCIVDSGQVPGIIAYERGVPVGWCSVAPRQVFTVLERSRVAKPVDDKPVWSITCLFVAASHRRSGVGVALLKAAVDLAAKHGATIVEGYPIEPKTDPMPAAFAWVGLAEQFKRGGFKEVVRRSETRPIMRATIRRNRR